MGSEANGMLSVRLKLRLRRGDKIKIFPRDQGGDQFLPGGVYPIQFIYCTGLCGFGRIFLCKKRRGTFSRRVRGFCRLCLNTRSQDLFQAVYLIMYICVFVVYGQNNCIQYRRYPKSSKHANPVLSPWFQTPRSSRAREVSKASIKGRQPS
jgi:hypothetical protein